MSRITSDVPGFEGNWVEFSDDQRWTRAEVTEANSAGEEVTLALLRKRASACQLLMEDGTVIDDPKDLSSEILDGMAIELIGFIGGSIGNYLRQRQVLGNVKVRHSSNGSVPVSAQKSLTP